MVDRVFTPGQRIEPILRSDVFGPDYLPTLSPNDLSNRTVIVGDSITQQNNYLVNSGRWSDVGYVAWANTLLGGRLDIVNNAGVNGDRTADVLRRIDADVIRYRPRFVVEMCGTNDMSSPLLGLERVTGLVLVGLGAAAIAKAVKDTVADIIASKTAYYRACLDAGATVFACAITPSSDWLGFQHGRDIWGQVTEWQRRFCQETPGMVFVDTATPMVNPNSPLSLPVNQGVDNDGLHPYARSAQAIGAALADAMEPFIPKVLKPLHAVDAAGANNPRGNVIPNTIWEGSGGTILAGVTVTGTVPNGWQLGASTTGGPAPQVTISKVAHPTIPGAFVLRLAVTFAATTAFQSVELQPINPLAFVNEQAGHEIDWDLEFRIVSADAGALGFSMLMTDFNAAFSVLGTCGYVPNVFTLPIAPMANMGRWVSNRRPYRLGAGTAFRYFKVAVNNSSNATGTITFDLGRLYLRNSSAQ